MDKILVVDDEQNIHYSFQRVFGHEYEVLSAYSGQEALQQLTDPALRLVLMDVRMPGKDGLATLQELKQQRPDLPVIMMTAFVSAETAIRATTFDAEDYLEKPLNIELLKQLIADTLQQRSQSQHAAASISEDAIESDSNEISAIPLFGHSPAMQQVYKTIGKTAARDVTVLITGESGTGKELVARALHTYSHRSMGPFLALNCAAIPDSLLESELFGHERGAFTGATEARPGKFELAHRGSLFLDEIGDMPLALQSKLLRVLQERELYRLGARDPKHVDVRIIAATNQELEGMLRTGRFREDLYYRLNVVRMTLPPLRERGEDIVLLANRFLHRQRQTDGQGPRSLSDAARQALLAYAWPGNVRELENVIAQTVVRARGPVIRAEDLALSESGARLSGEVPEAETSSPLSPRGEMDGMGTLLDPLFTRHSGNVFAVAEQLLFSKALELARHNQVQAARLLGVSRNVLRDRMKRYDLS